MREAFTMRSLRGLFAAVVVVMASLAGASFVVAALPVEFTAWQPIDP
jgi:hypothetical protein